MVIPNEPVIHCACDHCLSNMTIYNLSFIYTHHLSSSLSSCRHPSSYIVNGQQITMISVNAWGREHTYTYADSHTQTYTHSHRHTHTYTHIHAHTQTRTQTHMYTHTYIHTHTHDKSKHILSTIICVIMSCVTQVLGYTCPVLYR